MKKIALILIILLFATVSFAHDENVRHHVNMDNPAGLVNPDGFFEYMIIKGDYLWLLADKFYNDPFKWTEIHGANPYIIDPNWIYPNNWLVIPSVFANDTGKPIYGLPPTKATISSEPTTLVLHDNDGNVIIDESGETIVIEGYSVDLNSDGVIDGYDTDDDGAINVMINDAVTLTDYNAAKTKAEAKSAKEDAAAALAATTATTITTERMARTERERVRSSVKSYCGKPGWKLGLHAGYPLSGGPEDENLNLGLLLGTPLGVKAGSFSAGLGAGAFTYNFDKYYFGAGLLASICINDLFKLDSPLILQLHGLGFYVFGEDQGLGFGVIGSGSVPLGKSPISLGLYGALGKYSPDDNDIDWSNVGVILFYSL